MNGSDGRRRRGAPPTIPLTRGLSSARQAGCVVGRAAWDEAAAVALAGPCGSRLAMHRARSHEADVEDLENVSLAVGGVPEPRLAAGLHVEELAVAAGGRA